MEDCFYCENGEFLKGLMIEICKLKYSTIYLNKDQKHRGRCVVMYNDHKKEYFQLTKEENEGYFWEISRVAESINDLYNPNKINYATFGDKVPHIHMHIVPKYISGLQWGEAFNDGVEKNFLSDSEYNIMVSELEKTILSKF